MLNLECPGSIHVRFSSIPAARLFFEPVQLHLQLSDLFVQRRLQRVCRELIVCVSSRHNFPRFQTRSEMEDRKGTPL